MGLFKKKGPPSASDVAKRARVLAHLIRRSAACPPPDVLSEFKGRWSSDEWREFGKSLESASAEVVDDIKAEGTWDAVSRKERRLFSTPPHALSTQDAINTSWRNEALRTILWALNIFDDVGSYDQETPVESTTSLCFERVDPTRATLLPLQRLEQQRDIAETWHWRSRTRTLQEGRNPIPLPPGITMDEVIKMSAESMVELGAFPAALGDDFPAMGKPYRDLTNDEWSLVRSITMERHHALNWVCGHAPKNDWDRTPTDT